MDATPLIPRAPCSPTTPLRVAVLVSGSGSNLQAMLDAFGDASSQVRVEVVVSNVPGAKALDRAAAAGVPSLVVDHKGYADRPSFERALLEALSTYSPELIVLAGFMRILSPTFIEAFARRIVNVHPALCPAFPGTHAARQALAAGARITGCTVHLVDSGVDTGPILAQAAVPILTDDDEARLQQRIQGYEHRLLPRVLRALAEGHAVTRGNRVLIEGLEPEAWGLGWRA